MRNSILAALAVFCTPVLGQQDAEGFRCNANNQRELTKHLNNTPGAFEDAMQAKALLETRTDGFTADAERGGDEPYIVPMVFHIIHNNGVENITDAQVYDAVRILTNDYTKQNADWPNVRPEFLDIVADVNIEFRLATLDPEGNCTNGITRTVSTQTYDGDFDMTQLIQWPRDQYMNIWVAASAGSGVAGYTYYPQWLNNWPEADGIVIGHNYVGSIGTSSIGSSRVLSHEAGHWLNLAHCWGSTNDPGEEDNCFSDDGVSDTPNTIGWQSCFLQAASCGSPLDNVENYMEYSYCGKMFTVGQGNRIIAALTSTIAQRSSLWQLSNLAQTGVTTDPVLCAADFLHGNAEICTGSTVQFTDISYNNVTQRMWTFPGGTPSTSSDEQPIIQYDAPGTYPVSLQVSDGVNDLTVSQQDLIVVYADTGYAVPFNEGFEAQASIPDNEWIVSDVDQNGTFQLTSSAASSGANSIMLTNNSSMVGSLDNIYSPTYDYTNAGEVVISFRYAFAMRNANNDDRLRFYVSNNCGTTWSMRKQLRAGIDLTTGGIVGGSYVPNDPSEWGYAVVDNISSNYHSSDFRIRFEFLSDGGNNVYIDDINLSGTPLGLDVLSPSENELQVIPNPATETAFVQFTPSGSTAIDLSIIDPTGRLVKHVFQGKPAIGVQRISMPISELSAGIYMIRLTQGDEVHTVRFIVDHTH